MNQEELNDLIAVQDRMCAAEHANDKLKEHTEGLNGIITRYAMREDELFKTLTLGDKGPPKATLQEIASDVKMAAVSYRSLYEDGCKGRERLASDLRKGEEANRELRETNLRLACRVARVQALQATIDKLRGGTVDDLNMTIAALRKALEDIHDRNKRLTDRVMSLRAAAERSDSVNRDLRDKVDKLRSGSVDETAAKIRKMEDHISALQSKISRQSKYRTAGIKTTRSLKAQLEGEYRLKRKCADLEEQVSTLEREKTQTQRNHTALSTKLHHLEIVHEGCRREIKEALPSVWAVPLLRALLEDSEWWPKDTAVNP